MKTTKQILYEAAAIVERGWCQGKERDCDRFCAYGAIRKASGFGLASLAAIFRFSEFIDSPAIGRWNDAPERTQGEVVLALGFAAEMAGSDE